MNRYKTLALIFLLSLFYGCSGDSFPKGRLQKSLEHYYSLWQSRDIERYSITYQRDCLCEPSYHSSLIENASVVSSWNEFTHVFESEDELQRYTTVEYLFELIHYALEVPTDGIYVDFDPEYGYPREVEIYFAGPWGDYIRYRIEDFSAGEYVEQQYFLNIAQQNWQSEFTSDYTFTLEVSCFCDLHGEVLDVTVADGEVVSASDSLGNELAAEDLALVPTVAGMFQSSQAAMDNDAAGVVLDFDSMWGFPTMVSVNTTPQFADDEYTWLISDMQIDFTVANQNKLDYYSALWEAEKPSAYHYQLWSSELTEALQYHVEVVDDVPRGAHWLNAWLEWEEFDPLSLDYVLVEDYFALIENALTQSADSLIVYYDEELGYPADIFIDQDMGASGDEQDYSLQITHLR